jgi:uncharacterized protein
MDGVFLGLFLFAAFLGGFASGLAGFAMGFVVSGFWLHILSPIQTTTLIVGYGLLTQGYGVWKLRQSLAWRTLTPFIVGGVIGVPIGTVLLTYVDAAYLRTGVGVLLVIYGVYGLAQPKFTPVAAGAAADGGIGLANGILAGLTGLPGFIITVWCQLRGWTKDVQRAVFQPVMLAAIVMNVIALTVVGAITAETLRLFALGLPALLAGLWAGFKLYGKLDDATFRKLILVLLLFSGLGLIAPRFLAVFDLARSAERSQSVIVFVCEHGSSKSVLAAELFNRVAEQRRISTRAISRAVSEKTVDTAVPPVLVRSLSGDGFNAETFRPQPLTTTEAKTASHVIIINYDTDVEVTESRPVEHWTIEHPVTLEYDGAKIELSALIDALMERLTSEAERK